jgi:cobalt-zinc-cadmium efflux system protein
MPHDHHPEPRNEKVTGNKDSRPLGLALILTGTFMVVEVVGGIISGSLALLADAGHMLTDTMALALAFTAINVSSRPPDAKRSYGYHRFQILAAFVNGISLLFITGWILVEAIQRLMSPVTVMGLPMIIVATCGLVVNVVVFLILSRGNRNNLNVRGALLHVAGDLLGSAAAIVAALVILQTGWTPIDPLLSVLVAILILRSAWSLLKRSGHILLEGVPEWLDMRQIQHDLVARVPALSGVHHVHVWGLTPERLMLTMHVTLNEDHGDTTAVIRQIKTILRQTYGIEHSTVEIETGNCADE